jgi:hypothetical protein
MMLIACATHLMSVMVVSQYFKHKLLAVFRILLITTLYLATALLLSNQNANPHWPTSVPPGNETDTLLVLPAACFQDSNNTLNQTLRDTFGRGGKHLFDDVLLKSNPGNHVVGWNVFIFMVLWFGFAIVAELWRYGLYRYNRAAHNRGRKPAQFLWLKRFIGPSNKLIGRLFWGYQALGVAFCIVAISFTLSYILKLKDWMNDSPWIKKAPDGTNPEYDATTFGQLVPLLLILLTVFTVLQLIGGKSIHCSRQTLTLILIFPRQNG